MGIEIVWFSVWFLKSIDSTLTQPSFLVDSQSFPNPFRRVLFSMF